jgi:hypothetical protein
MPSPGELPEPLWALTRLREAELSDAHWDYDVERLLRRLEELLEPPDFAAPPAPAERPRRRSPFRWWSDKRGQRTADEDEVSDVEQDLE